jgi:hypothetical protein
VSKNDWHNLPVGSWFLMDDPSCTDRYSVQERTSGGSSIVCSTPYHNETAKRNLEEIVRMHNWKRIWSSFYEIIERV